MGFLTQAAFVHSKRCPEIKCGVELHGKKSRKRGLTPMGDMENQGRTQNPWVGLLLGPITSARAPRPGFLVVTKKDLLLSTK